MNFLVFSDDWGIHPSSCQHLFRQLAPEHPTVWVNTVGMRSPRISLEDLRKGMRKLSAMLSHAGTTSRMAVGSAVDSGGGSFKVTVCSPRMAPLRWPSFLLEWNFRSIVRSVSTTLDSLGFSEFCLVTTVPNIHGAVDRLGASKVIYYCVDDFSEWPGMERDATLEMESRLLRSVDSVIATSQALFDKFSTTHPTHLLTHGVDLETFTRDSVDVHRVLNDVPEPRVGYFGLLDDRSDIDLLVAVATELPDVSFVFTGPTEGDLSSLRRLPNTYFSGSVPYPELPSVIAGWRACFLPYRMNALTEKINPLKLKEYLASGKPVVSTPLPEATRLRNYLRIAVDVDEWCAAIRNALNGEWHVDRDATLHFLQDESWASKASQFLAICEKA